MAISGLKADIKAFSSLIATGNVDTILGQYSKLADDLNVVYGYIGMVVSVDTRNETALAKESEIEALLVDFRNSMNEFYAWVGTLDLDSVLKNPLANQHSFLLKRAKHRSEKLMSPEEENLASELNLYGASAWARLHAAITSQLEVTVEFATGPKLLPMSSVRNLAHDSDRSVRKSAYEAELSAWKTVEVPLAAAMNGIKGQVGTICRRRGWGEGIDEAVFDNSIDRETLDVMLEAARESFPDFRRYLKAKAKSLGLETLEWYDLFAPQSEGATWPYEKGSEFVAEQFDAFSPKMGDFARRSYREHWIDWPPVPGKIDGAYCCPVRGDESRILMNYDGTFGNVKTLAHELGHAYHTLCLARETPLNRETPSTLAETASIFCETIVKNAALAKTEGAERIKLLEACLVAPTQVVVDITSRYLFEKAVFDQRPSRDLSPQELCEIMLDTQRDTFGDGLNSYHPYMWAVKPHYYSTSSYYNFPYMFGLLFALGLYNQYKVAPEGFVERYDDLLASTGKAEAYELGSRFGFNTRSIDFWRGSLDVVRADINSYCEYVA